MDAAELRQLVREVLRDLLPAQSTSQAGQARPVPSGLPAAPPTSDPAPSRPTAGGGAAAGTGAAADGAVPVRLATDEDLHEFVLRVLRLADNPKRRRDLLAGRLRFTLAPGGPASAAPTAPAGPAVPTGVPGGNGPAATVGRRPAMTGESGGGMGRRAGGGGTRGGPGGLSPPGEHSATPGHRIDKGAVTERAVQAAASAGVRLVLGPRAVLTPLARDRARALGVPIEKER
jgi:hypothetical protein